MDGIKTPYRQSVEALLAMGYKNITMGGWYR